ATIRRTISRTIQRMRTTTLEDWNTVLQVGSAIVLCATFVIGTGALWTSYVLGKRQELRIAAIQRDAAEANERTKRLEIEAAEQRERAAVAERQLLELQQRMKPRNLTDIQRSAITSAMVNFSFLPNTEKRQSAAVFATSIAFEATTLADQIAESLKNAGWDITETMLLSV